MIKPAAVIAFMMMWTSLSPSLARGDWPAWTHTQIANVDGVMPSISVDRLGYVHVGWTHDAGSSWLAYHVENEGGFYRLSLVDSKSGGSPAPLFPFISTDGMGFYHLVWRELGITGKPVFYRTNNPITRTLVKSSFHSSGHTHDPIVDLTSDGVAHVVTEADSCTGCPRGSNLYDESFAVSASHGGPVVSLTQDLNDATGLQQFSSTVTADDTRHLVFSMRLAPPADNQRLIYYSARTAGSLAWSTPVSITGHQDNYQGWPGIVAAPDGTLHVVYSSGDYGIYYVKKPPAGAWSAPLRINDQNAVVDAIPSITMDPNGRLHVAFMRYTPVPGSAANISLHYTTNAFDENNWLDPAPQVLSGLASNGLQVTHQNRKIGINWVDGEVLIPYMQNKTIWLASTTDVPVTPLMSAGTSTLVATPGFVAPTTLARSASNTAATATTVLKFNVVDDAQDMMPTRVRHIHVNTGGEQSRPRVVNKDEGLSYLLGGARLVVGGNGPVITGIVSDSKIVFADPGESLWVGNGETLSFEVQIWLKNLTFVTGKTIDLRIKPDQDVVHEAGSGMAVDQPVVASGAMLIVDGAAVCAAGSPCDDGNACTYNDQCNGSGGCAGTAIACSDDACHTRMCNGSASCTVTPKSDPVCTDVNECTTGAHNCSVHAICMNAMPGFTCTCMAGYFGDGVTCTSVMPPPATYDAGASEPDAPVAPQQDAGVAMDSSMAIDAAAMPPPASRDAAQMPPPSDAPPQEPMQPMQPAMPNDPTQPGNGPDSEPAVPGPQDETGDDGAAAGGCMIVPGAVPPQGTGATLLVGLFLAGACTRRRRR